MTKPDQKRGEAVMFRDAEYGALVVETADRGLVAFDFGFQSDDAKAAHATLSRYAVFEKRDDETRWTLDRDAHGLAVLSTLKQEMRLRGYQPDKLAERATFVVKAGEVRRPDLPATGKVLVHDAVDAGIRQHLGLVVASLREGGTQVAVPSLRYYQRPNAENRGSGGAMRPPFVVSRFFVETTKPADALREAVRVAMGDFRDYLVKLAVVAEGAGKHAVEMGFAPPASLCESFLDAAIPTFEHSNILGVRAVDYDLAHALTEEERKDIEALGRSCTGCVRIQQEGTRIVVEVPSNLPGHYGADHALHERLAWLGKVLEPWDPSLQDIGPLAEVNLSPDMKPEELAEYRRMNSGQKAKMAKSRKMLAHNSAHQRELLQRRKDWKKNRGAQKKASVWRKRTASMRGESVAECDEEHGMGNDDAANMVNGDVVATLASRFAKMPPAWWDTPQGEDALRKAKALIKDEHGEDAAERFDKQLELLRLTSSPTMKAEAAIEPPLEAAQAGRNMLKAAGTFVSEPAKMDGSDDEEEKGVCSYADDEVEDEENDEDGDGESDGEDEEGEEESEGDEETDDDKVDEDFAAYLGEPGRGSKKSQYLLVGRGTNARLVANRGRTNLHRLGPASLVTVETEGDDPLPIRVDGTRKELAKALDGKIVDEEDNRFGGVESVESVTEEEEVSDVERGVYRVAHESGKRRVSGFIIGGVFGIPKDSTAAITMGAKWNLTHIPTGFGVSFIDGYRQGVEVAKTLLALPGVDWSSKKPAELLKHKVVIAAAIKLARSRVRH